MKYRVITSSVNVRALPNITTGRVTGTLRKDAEFIASELTPDSKWARSPLGWVCVYDALRKYCELVPEPAGEPAPSDDWRADVERRLKRLENIAGL